MKAPANRGGKANKDTLSRNYINDLMGRLRKMFRWAAARRMIPTSIAFEVTSIEPLRRGRCDARETEKVKPVPTRDLNAVLDVAPPHLADMIRLQLLTGARPGEICTMRTCDLDTSRPVWKYTPAAHKTDYAGFERPIFIGPQAQEILTPRLKADLQASIFNPWDAYAAAREAARKASKSRHLKPLKPKGSCGRIKNDRYTVMVYWHMVNRACQLADRLAHENRPDVPADVVLVNPWHPHQLRHNAATLLRKAYGLDVAKAVLGHQNTSVTEIYAEQDYEKAQDAIAKLG